MGEDTIGQTEFFFHLGTSLERLEKTVAELEAAEYVWIDAGWRSYAKRFGERFLELPLNIYDLDLFAWRRLGGKLSCSYAELASELAVYVKQMGYTHISLKDVDRRSEMTFGELKAFVDQMHEAGIGVILCCGFENIENQTLNVSAIASAVARFLDAVHADGIKVCVSSFDGNAELVGDFFDMLNKSLKELCPSVILIAEKSHRGVCVPSTAQGFDFVCDMSRTNRVLEYVSEDPIFRKHHHEKLITCVASEFGEREILTVSEGEGGMLLEASAGDRWQKFATLRALHAYRMTLPCKKTTFMGAEMASRGLDWGTLNDDLYAKFQLYISELNSLYLENAPLWQSDFSAGGFEWIDANDKERSVLSYRRKDKAGRELIVVVNFTPVVREGYELRVARRGEYEEIFNSDSEVYGGSGVINKNALFTAEDADNGKPYSIALRVPPLGVTILKYKS